MRLWDTFSEVYEASPRMKTELVFTTAHSPSGRACALAHPPVDQASSASSIRIVFFISHKYS